MEAYQEMKEKLEIAKYIFCACGNYNRSYLIPTKS